MEEHTFLTFVVMNTRLLKTGGAASHQFKQEGGYIGNDESCHWVLPDPNNALITPYCQIKFQNGQYHLVDIQGGIGVNEQDPQFEQNKAIIVHNGDVFRIGSYQLKAHLKVVEVEMEQSYKSMNESVEKDSPHTYIPQLDIDLPPSMDVSVSSSEITKPRIEPEANKEKDMSPTSDLLRSEQSEVESLKASIEGLVSIHSRQDSYFHLLNRSFQPIQDNPLQMGLSVNETEKLMFGQNKSLFHLDPAQAISTSLQSIENHSERIHQSTTIALKYILNELSPDVLLKRFQTYKKNAPDNVDSDAWAWKMYQSYFSELTSGRQKGFEKQFWEVLERSYDSIQRQDNG
ncbi:type VI secretion system-associated FHA domain protein [Vibrio casei]|uniref:type VI secretion system-associated FHA domain protein n=1 Tax=Vibrio casei TaxID=673372 RepID=UPI003F9C8CCC